LAALFCYESAVPDPTLYAVFLVAAVTLLETPGPAVHDVPAALAGPRRSA
jgi:hypothetical protein